MNVDLSFGDVLFKWGLCDIPMVALSIFIKSGVEEKWKLEKDIKMHAANEK